MKKKIKRNTNLKQSRLKQVMHYNPFTGIFTRKISLGCRKKGDIVHGGNHSSGYKFAVIDKESYNLSRLAFLYMEGYFPENDIDHINRVRHDNRWVNLREVTRSCNAKNRIIRSDNSTGVTGVSFDRFKNKWVAGISINGKHKHLSYHNKKAEAVYARWFAEVENNYHDCDKMSTAYLYLKERSLI